jgi:hypothetical protein
MAIVCDDWKAVGSGVVRPNTKESNMKDYEKQIKLKFKLLAAFYVLFDIPFLLNRKKNPRRTLVRKISNWKLL